MFCTNELMVHFTIITSSMIILKYFDYFEILGIVLFEQRTFVGTITQIAQIRNVFYYLHFLDI